MAAATVSYATPADAIRVFCGFPRKELNQSQFFTQLGSTFMPGTPYMLQPLGLAAYLPGVLADPAPGLPHEFALICYPSVDVWKTAMSGTLRGRLYNQTHGGVYAIPPSGASFPVFLDDLLATAADPYFLFPAPIDWQLGGTRVAVAGKRDAQQTGPAFRTALRQALSVSRPAWEASGVDQVILGARDDFLVIWMHAGTERAAPDLSFLLPITTTPTVLNNQRVICRDEPPVLNITTSAAYNFIFLRETRYFLQ